MLRRTIPLILLVGIFFNNLSAHTDEPFHESAFMRPKYSFDSLAYYSYYITDHFWSGKGKKLPAYNHFIKHSVRSYSEFFFTDRDSVSLNGGYSAVKESINRNSQGIEDLELGWQHQFYQKNCSALSVKCTATVPVGPKKSCIRYGKFACEAKILYSKAFQTSLLPFWYDLDLGYKFYQGFPSDRINADAALGCRLFRDLFLILAARMEYSVNNGDSAKNLNNICFHPNQRLASLQAQLLYRLCSHITISLGGFQHVWGRNVGAGGGFYAGSWFDF